MLFNALSFAVFLPFVFGIYWLIGCLQSGSGVSPLLNKEGNVLFSKRRDSASTLVPFHLQNLFVVAASYVFYGWWDWKFLLLITFTSLWAWASGLAIDRTQRGSGVSPLHIPPRGIGGGQDGLSPSRSSLTSASSAYSSIATSFSTTPSLC